MDDAELIPGECDVREWMRAALLDYRIWLDANREAWSIWHERRGIPTPSAGSLDAEACIVLVGMFRDWYDGHSLHVAPLLHYRPEGTLGVRLN